MKIEELETSEFYIPSGDYCFLKCVNHEYDSMNDWSGDVFKLAHNLVEKTMINETYNDLKEHYGKKIKCDAVSMCQVPKFN
jgi:hypothetical protein